MMTWSINLFVLAIGFLIVGTYKPQLLLFWMDKPKRMPIVLFSGFYLWWQLPCLVKPVAKNKTG